jgi:hypothetical protein
MPLLRQPVCILQRIPISLLLVLAATLEVSGDAVVRINHRLRPAGFLIGAVLLLSYASVLNTAPVGFPRIVGLYIATLFVIWQIISYLAFKAVPATPVLFGGALIIAGGLIITLWRPTA